MTNPSETKLREIDQVDEQLITLLERRAQLAVDLAAEKLRAGRPVFDPQYELAILNKVKKFTGGLFPQSGLLRIFSEVVSACRNLRARAPIAFLGEKFGWVHDAALGRFGASAILTGYEAGEEILEAIQRNETDTFFFPLHHGGDMPLLLETFLGENFFITGEELYSQQFTLFSADEHAITEITEIFVTREAMTMLRQWILSLEIPARISICRSMVEVVENLVPGRHAAGIVAENLARTFEGHVVRNGLEAFAGAPIRCLTMSSKALPFVPHNKASVLCSLASDSESMQALLAPLTEFKCPLLGIEMFRFQHKAWNELYFVDFATPDTEDDYQRILAAMAGKCRLFKPLGQYPAFS